MNQKVIGIPIVIMIIIIGAYIGITPPLKILKSQKLKKKPNL